jgi:hypothetical protein
MAKTIRVRDGYELVMNIYAHYRSRIYDYNTRIRESGYYLKPVHMVYKEVEGRRVKYVYFGRYWYRIYKTKSEGRARIKWIYVGRDKPEPELPEPPINPLEGIAVIVDGNDILIDARTLEALSQLAKALKQMGLISDASLKGFPLE